MDCSHAIQVVPLEEKHVLDFLSWTDYDDPLFAMYNFSEDEDTVGDWFRWKTKSRRDRYFAILVEGRAAGYMGLKGISRISRSAELGINFGPGGDRRGRGPGGHDLAVESRLF